MQRHALGVSMSATVVAKAGGQIDQLRLVDAGQELGSEATVRDVDVGQLAAEAGLQQWHPLQRRLVPLHVADYVQPVVAHLATVEDHMTFTVESEKHL